MIRSAAGLFLAAGLFQALPVAAESTCKDGSGARMTGPADAPFVVTIDVGSDGIPLSAPFEADVTICPLESGTPSRIAVDATMPAHQHGMNYDPEIVSGVDGVYEVTGLFFHMPGVWRFEVTAFQDGKPNPLHP